jgi:hypothetical protein
MKKSKRYEKSTLEAWKDWAEQTERDWELTAHVPATEEVTLADLLAEYDPAVLRQWISEQEQQEQQQTLPDKPLTNEE